MPDSASSTRGAASSVSHSTSPRKRSRREAASALSTSSMPAVLACELVSSRSASAGPRGTPLAVSSKPSSRSAAAISS